MEVAQAWQVLVDLQALPDDLRRCCEVPEPPAGHRIGLARGIDGDHVIAELCGAVVLLAIDEVLVHFIGDDRDALVCCVFHNRLDRFFALDRAGRVAGRVQDKDLRLVHQFFGLLDIDMEGLCQRDADRLPPARVASDA